METYFDLSGSLFSISMNVLVVSSNGLNCEWHKLTKTRALILIRNNGVSIKR